MKIILQKESKESRADYRDYVCILCGEDCNPCYRFFYYSKETDKHKNSIIDGEVHSCDKCYTKISKMF